MVKIKMLTYHDAIRLVEKNPNEYVTLPYDLQCEPYIASLAVKQNMQLFEAVPFELIDNEESIWKMFCEVPQIMLKYVPERYKQSGTFIKRCVQLKPRSIQFADRSLKCNPTFMTEVVAVNGLLLEYGLKNVKNNKEVVLAAIKQNPKAIKYASDDLRDDIQIGMIVVASNGMMLKHLSKRLQSNKEIVLTALSNNGNAYSLLEDKTLLDDQDICYRALKNGCCINYMGGVWGGLDLKVIIRVVKHEPDIVAFTFGRPYLSNDCVSDSDRDRDFVLKCIERNPRTFAYFDEAVHSDAEIAMKAVQEDPTNLRCVRCDDVLNDQDIIYDVMLEAPILWRFAGQKLRDQYGNNLEQFLFEYQSQFIK